MKASLHTRLTFSLPGWLLQSQWGKNICFLGSWFGWWWYFAAHKTVSFPHSLQIFKGICNQAPHHHRMSWVVGDRQANRQHVALPEAAIQCSFILTHPHPIEQLIGMS